MLRLACHSSALCRRNWQRSHLRITRWISDSGLHKKYEERIRRRLEEEGVTNLSEFKARIQKSGDVPKAFEALETRSKKSETPQKPTTSSQPGGQRKDGSPIRPLSSILNLPKLFETPHTTEQISALWTAHHVSKLGCLSAVVPVSAYMDMLSQAKKFPSFCLPIPRKALDGESSTSPAYEFYFLQWSIHEVPPDPRTVPQFPFDPPERTPESIPPNPQTSAILFTSLAEYKLHNSFATPHLVLTNYTDLAQSHGVVLLRGDITPTSGDPQKLRIPSTDAQFLALGSQKFYLSSSGIGLGLLKMFHEEPGSFRWEEVVEVLDFPATV